MLGGQAKVEGVSGTWKDLTDNVNGMATNLTNQVRNIAEVTTAVAQGDLSQKITVDVRGEVAELKTTINTMVGQLSSFAEEVTRVAREVGTEGVLGGQAKVEGVSGTWKDLTDNVNGMASNLTIQVRSIITVMRAIAAGDLSQRFTLDARGEIAVLTDTINNLTDRLNVFAEQVIQVAREVGTDGRLGGQAVVPGVSGTWKDLTENVNELAANLTTQVRAIAEVAESVTNGDYSRIVQVEASGEVDDLKSSVNHMINTLKITTQENFEQDWLKTNLAEITKLLGEQTNQASLAKMLFTTISGIIEIHAAMYFTTEFLETSDGAKEIVLRSIHGYAFNDPKHSTRIWRLGEGLVGQCAEEMKRITIREVPDDYMQIDSGLGTAKPTAVIMLPIQFDGELLGVIEFATFQELATIELDLLEQLTESVGIIVSRLSRSEQSAELLTQSIELTTELQSQRDELRSTNDELKEKALLLANQNEEVEKKNELIKAAQIDLQEHAQQLSITSRYKSEFLANMSHELRSPLNSLLILSRKLTENAENNLEEKQVTWARTIFQSGTELLELINDVLDLSKVEAGQMKIDSHPLEMHLVTKYLHQQFDHVPESKGVLFSITVAPDTPNTITTDRQRLYQILKNLLSNAFKFTVAGEVNLTISPGKRDQDVDPDSDAASTLLSFRVSDTGIGIDEENREKIFLAFQQADASTSRAYGGTGLGLSISRRLADSLGGDLQLLESSVGKGSCFELTLPSDRIYSVGQTDDLVTIGNQQTYPALPISEKEEKNAHKYELDPNKNFAPALVLQRKQFQLEDDRDSLKEGDFTLLIFEANIAYNDVIYSAAKSCGMKSVRTLDLGGAFQIIENNKIDLVSLDFELPAFSSITFIQLLRMNPDIHHVPFLGYSETTNTELERKVGFRRSLPKSIDNKDLLETLEELKHEAEAPLKLSIYTKRKDFFFKTFFDKLDAGRVEINFEKNLSLLKHQNSPTASIVDLDSVTVKALEEFLQSILSHWGNAAFLPIILHGDLEKFNKHASSLQVILGKGLAIHVTDDFSAMYHLSQHLIYPLGLFGEDLKAKIISSVLTDISLENARILIVDDDMRNIYALTTLLDDYGVEVDFATDGEEALEIINSIAEFTLVFMDIMMPKMDGYTAMAEVRKMSRHKHLPIIALTADAMPETKIKALSAGADDYISKPILDSSWLVERMKMNIMKATDRKGFDDHDSFY